MIPEIDSEKCTGCGDCVERCPGGAVEVINGKAVVVSPDNCNYCTECETLCPSAAIECPFYIVLKTEPKRLPGGVEEVRK